MTATVSGLLLIADITGYTAYLSASELEHAQETLTDLLELLIKHTQPPLVISRLAGDAVISYALQDQFKQGQTFVETIENTYVAFRRAIERMVLNNTCRCQACANVGALDLKFFVHYGAFGLQKLGGHDELVGSDVIVIHRLLKNHVTEQTGLRAYTLYTDAAVQHLGLTDMTAGMTAHTENYEHLGDVPGWVQDMTPIWESRRAADRVTIAPDDIGLQIESEIAMPPNVVWGYLVEPEFRRALVGSDSQSILNRLNGRVDRGSQYHCYHGKQLIVQTIVEWQPFEQLTSEDLVAPGTTALIDYHLEPTETGTRLTETFSKPHGPLHMRVLSSLLSVKMQATWRENIETFRQRIEADLAQRGGLPPAAPPIPEHDIAEAASASLTAKD